jgi:hypothetical protein
MDELLKFDKGRHDDFIDPLAHIGRELGQIVRANKLPDPATREPRPGTFAWIKWASAEKKLKDKRIKAQGGF